MRMWIKLGALTLLLGAPAAGVGAPPPVEAFGNKPAMGSVDINPSGTRLAWIEDDGKSPRIVIHDVANNTTLRRVSAPAGAKLWGVIWANDDTVLIDQSVTQTINLNRDYTEELQRWVALDASGGADRMLLMRDATREWVSGVLLQRRRTANPGTVFMSTWDWSAAKRKEEIGTRLAGRRGDSGWTHNLYEVDLQRGSGKVIATGTAFTIDWLADPSGKVIVRSEYVPKDEQFGIFAKDGAGWKKIYAAKGCDTMGLVNFTADLSAVLAVGSNCVDDRHKFWSIPMDGSAAKVLHENPELDVESVYTDPFDDSVLGVSLGGAAQPAYWIDARAEKRMAALKRSFGGKTVTLMSRTADNQKVVVLVEDSSHVPVYYLVDFAGKKADIINEAYPLLAGVKLGAVSDFHYKARDEYGLLGYLTLPPDSPGKNLPLVVMPHGGPESRDEPGFDWLAQFLASRGYAVLQPQFRGSSGFGRAHADAGRRQWGLRMQDDVTDGVQALVQQGIADPKRVCIVGWSYGGYSALAGAAFTPELYACAVSIAGISDLPEMLGWDSRNSGGRESNSFAYWREHIGKPDDPQVIAKSPARSASTVRAPVLLIHGRDDTVVPASQSRQMATALRQLNKPVELIELDGEDHWMKTSSHSRIRTLTELERFLGKYIGTAAGTSTMTSN